MSPVELSHSDVFILKITMGNAALRDIADITDRSLDHFKGQRVAVDAHHWLHKYMRATARWMDEDYYTTPEGKEVLNILVLLRGIPTILNAGIDPVFVFDGQPDDRKDDEIAKRREAHEEASEKLEKARENGDTEAIKRFRSQTQKLTPTVQKTSREVLELLGIPYVEAPAAGEAHAAHLAQAGLVDSVMTDDYDALLFGSPTTIRNYTSNGDTEEMDLGWTRTIHGLTQAQLVDLALLCGTDYNDGVHGIGPKTALKHLDGDGRAEDALEAKNAEIANLDELRDLFLTRPMKTSELAVPNREAPNFETLYAYTVDEWLLPADRVQKNLNKFPKY